MLLAGVAINLVITSFHLFVGGHVGRMVVTGVVAIVGVFVYSLIVKYQKRKAKGPAILNAA